MAVTVTFADGTVVQCARSAFCGTMEHQGQRRKYIEMYFNSDDIALSDLKSIWTNTNMTSEITTKMVTEVDGVEKITENVHLNMTLPVSLGYSTQSDGTELITMRLAQMSDMEIMQAQQASDITDTQAALIELADIIAGGEA